MDNKTQKLILKREVGLMGAVSLIGGTMIGSGIFMSPQTVLYNIGSPGASLVVWACCGVLVILASFCYAELGTVIRESGGEYIYILKTSGPVVAFMLIFSSVLFVRPASIAGIALSFAQYVVAPFYLDCTPPVLLVKCVAAAAIIVLATVNCLNVRFSMSVQVFFMVTKVLTLAVIIIGGMVDGSLNGSQTMESDKERLNLKREVGIIGAVSFIAGTMMGSGIFISPQYVLSTIGSPGASLIIWACCGLIAMLGGLCYAELGTVIPESGGEYVYILRTAGKVVAFMFVFSFIIVMRPASATGIALSFAEYAVAPFYNSCTPPQLVVKTVAAAAIVVLAIVNCLSARLATSIQVVSMVVKLLALAVIILGGVVMLIQGHTEDSDYSFEGTHAGVSSIGIAFYQGLWSYDGWNTLNYLTEELKHPEHLHPTLSVTMADKEPEALKMKREIGLIGGVALVSGTMIGSGIFMSPQFVLAYAGSPGASLVIWALSGVVSMFAALSYTELGTVICESGGDFIYILRIYGSCPAFFAAVTFILVVKPFGIAAMAISIAEYVIAPFYTDCHPPQLVVKCAAAVAILVVATVNILNVRIAIRIQVVFLVAKVLTLTLIIIGGIVELTHSTSVIVENLKVENAFKGTQYSLSTLGMSFYQGLWSYAGWYNLNYVTEELKRPEVNLPRAVVIAISLVTGLYVLVNVSYLTVMTPKELMSSSAVAVTWGNKVLGSWGWIMSVAAALSAFGSLNGTFFSGGRVCFVAAREGHMPDILAMAHIHRLTPSPALIFTTVVSLVVLIPGDFQSIVNFFSFTAWFFYAITLSGLLYLKIKKPELPRPYRVPIILPILVLIAAVFLVLAPIIDDPQIEYLYVTLFILSGAIVYIPFIHYKLCPGLLTKLTVFLQLFLEVAPAEKNL
ncbi:b(0,+)-type amino acid transporter 1 [Micropterus dolomieu]|uniref:b(0,+)-type amino acid transporter 1 n=1 Tax=Micropterus dolomieu TaxID=147949 RepID=UPI001E8D6948|nr:b(0,+)-type amino acid transporter 1 [Micropterus dolomieu]